MGAIPQGFSYARKEMKQCHTNQNVLVPIPAARDPKTNNRYGRSWKRIRDRYIKAHPLCEECQKQGKLTPAEEVHHILPLSKGGGNEKSNLMALCKSCHSRITAESGDRWGR